MKRCWIRDPAERTMGCGLKSYLSSEMAVKQLSGEICASVRHYNKVNEVTGEFCPVVRYTVKHSAQQVGSVVKEKIFCEPS